MSKRLAWTIILVCSALVVLLKVLTYLGVRP